MSSETVSIRLEGGIGDHLLANRFVFAIKEKHPNAQLNFYSDTENNPKQVNLLKEIWPSIYNQNNCKVMEARASKNFRITSQFGQETYNCHPSNIIDIYNNIFNDSDYYYNLCIDNLDWINYSFDWKRYFYFFPRPENEIPNPLNDNGYVLTHLFPRPDSDHNLEQWYVINLIKKILDTGKKVVSICHVEYMDFYKELIDLNHANFELVDCSLKEVFGLAKDCSIFLGADSGLRYFPLHYGKPSYVFSKYSSQPFSAPPSHLLRWLIFPEYVLPMHYDINTITSIVTNSINHPASSLFPYIQNNIDMHIIERKYI